MEITECKYRIRCEMGACGNLADYTVRPARTGVRSHMHICASCLGELALLGSQTLKRAKTKAEDGQ